MAMNGPSRVDPLAISRMSSAAIVATTLLGLGWLVGAAWSVIIAEARVDPPSTFEDPTPPVTIMLMLLLWGGFLVAGILWATWQRAMAVVASAGEFVRDPDWHARAWFSPIVMWWEPLRNMRELTKYLMPRGRQWLVPAWWVMWVPFRVMPWVVLWQFWMPQRFDLPPGPTGLAVALVSSASTLLAVVLIHLVTQGALARVRGPFVMNHAKRPFPLSRPLFIAGVVCRAATPIVVVWLLGEISSRFY